MRKPLARAAVALLLFSAWMALLFAGFALRGGVHLLLVGGLALFPWRAARASMPGRQPRNAATGFASTPTPDTSTST